MKRTLLILAALLCCCFALKAQDFTYENLNYHVTGTNPPTVELTGHAEGFTAHDFVIPSTVDYESTTYSVTSIGNSAFQQCSGLTGSLTIGNSVTSIGNYAFQQCSGLTGSLTIGNSVESIGEWAFGTTGLTIIIAKPATPPTMGGYAFGDSPDVESITVPCDGVEDYKSNESWSTFANKIKGGSFEYELTVTSANPELGTASITQYSDCESGLSIVTATLSAEGCRFIGWTENGVQVSTDNPYTFTLTADRNLVANFFNQYDFYADCSTGQTLYYRIIDAEQNRVSIVAPNNDDDSHCWDNFTIPTGQIELPETVEYDGVTYTVKTIGVRAFFQCVGLTGTLSIPNSVTSIEERAFTSCSGFTGSLTIPNSVTSIGYCAFAFCSGFNGPLTLGSSMTSIGGLAFTFCSGFNGSLTIPNSVTDIGIDAFYYCPSFNGTLTIGNSMTNIGNYAFRNTGFTQIIAKPTTPPDLYNYTVFQDMSNLQTIFVPCGSVDAYIASWGYAEIIEERSLDHDLTVASSNPELGTASITEYPDCSTGLSTVTATPAGINRFTGWTENGVVVSTDNPYTFTLTSDRNLVANFTECTYVYGPIMSIPSPIDPDAVYHLGYQLGNDYYLHTSGTAAGEMQLSKNPENPVEYKFQQFQGIGVFAHSGEINDTYLHIDTQGVSYGTFNPFGANPFSLSIQEGDISSAAASGYTVCHDENNIITTHTGTSEGNLRFFSNRIIKPLYHIVVSTAPEGAGTATATIGGEQVESAAEGTEITVTATPNAGSNFINWTENDEEVSSANPYTFTLTADRNLVANFFRQYDFSAICSTGQALYYRIIDAEQHWVSIVAPNSDDFYECYTGYDMPTGPITLPEAVTHNGTSYTVTEIGNYAFFRCEGLTGSLTIPNSVTSIGKYAFGCCSGFNGSLTIGDAVTSIGIYAFEQSPGFSGTLTIGNSVESIGDYAFMLCSNFTGSLTIPNSVTSIGICAFDGCSHLTGSLTIPNSVTSIGKWAFNECSGFTGTLTIPNSVTSIGEGAFADCSHLTGSLNIPNSVTSIGSCAFVNCSSFTGSLTIPNSVTSIGWQAFNNCSGFTGSLTIGSSVTSIDYWAFRNTQFTNIISKPVTPPTLSNDVFDGMTGLQAITVPCDKGNDYKASWSDFDDDMIAEDFVYELTVTSANTDLGTASITQQATCENQQVSVSAAPANGYIFLSWTENDMPISDANPYTFTLESDRFLVANFAITDQYDFSAICSTGQALYYRIIDAEQHWVSIVAPNDDSYNGWGSFTKPEGDITLPETVIHNGTSYTVTEIGAYAFYNCLGFTGSLSIPNSVKSIGNHAFNQCSGFIGSLTIGNSVESIGDYAFFQCSGFTGSLTIGSSVTSIGEFAFAYCSDFTGSLTIPNSVTSIGEFAFAYCSGFTGSLTIPNYVTSIKSNAFYFCEGLSGIIAKPTTPPDLGNNAFYYMTESLSIIVPCGLDVTYKASWSDYANKITEGFVQFDLTVASANPEFGTTSITRFPDCDSHSSTVTATPAENYMFVGWTENGMEVSTTNPYTFTLESDRNLVANFAVKPSYHITVSATPEEAGTATATCGGQPVESAFDGTEITVSATPTDCYRFINWTENGEEVSTENPYTFTLESDRNLVANFFKQYDFSAACSTGQTLYYRIIDAEQHWVKIVAPNGDNANGWNGFTQPRGDIELPETVEYDGTSYTVKAIGDCAFYNCDGLTGSLSIPNSVTSIEGCAFQNCWGFTGSLDIPNSVTSIGNYAFKGSGFTGSFSIPSSVTSIGIQAFAACWDFSGTLTIPNSVRSIGDEAFIDCSGFTGTLTIGNAVENIGQDAFGYCNFTSIISKAQTAPSLGSYIPNVTNDVFIPNNTTDSYETVWGKYGYNFIEIDEFDLEVYHFNGSTSSNAWSIASNWEENEVPSQNCLNVFIDADCQLDTDAEVGAVIVAAGKTFTINEGCSLTAGSSILEDGAQLINSGSMECNNYIIKKDIAGYGTDGGNWYLVSSPVATTSLPIGMTTDPADDYDLYRFDQTGDNQGREWLNYRAESFDIENQSGYLYANKNDTTILFRGGLADTGTKTLIYDANAEFAGFNLVGNPYPCNAYLANGRSFYRMNESGTEIIVDNANPTIAPCEGVFVQAQGTGESVTFTPSATPATRSLPAATVVLTLSQGRSAAAIDRAIVRLGEGDVLGKMMLNADGTRLYIPQNGKDYAVVSTSSTSGEIPLNFKAAKNGSYTITVNVENADLNYLHLVDNLTGNDVDLMGSEEDVARNVSTYTFDAKTDDYASRFKLVFGVNGDAASAGSAGNFAYISNGEIIISNEGRATLQVIDVLGRIVSSEEINGDCRISTNGMTAGVYILNLNGMTQKIVVR